LYRSSEKQQEEADINLNKYWRESRRKKKRLRERRETRAQAPNINVLTNAEKA